MDGTCMLQFGSQKLLNFLGRDAGRFEEELGLLHEHSAQGASSLLASWNCFCTGHRAERHGVLLLLGSAVGWPGVMSSGLCYTSMPLSILSSVCLN